MHAEKCVFKKKRTLEAPLSFLKFWGNTYNPPSLRTQHRGIQAHFHKITPPMLKVRVKKLTLF